MGEKVMRCILEARRANIDCLRIRGPDVQLMQLVIARHSRDVLPTSSNYRSLTRALIKIVRNALLYSVHLKSSRSLDPFETIRLTSMQLVIATQTQHRYMLYPI